MILNPHKYYFMLFAVQDGFQTNLASNLPIISQRKVLRAVVDKKPAFSTHRTNITEKANIKLNTLAEYKNT